MLLYQQSLFTAIIELSGRVRQLNMQAPLQVDENTWPPNYPKGFTPLVLVHYQDMYTAKQAAAIAIK